MMKFVVVAAVVLAVAVAQELAPVGNVIEVTGTAVPAAVARLRMPLLDRTSMGAAGKLERLVVPTDDGVEEDIRFGQLLGEATVVGGPAAPSPYDDASGLAGQSPAPAGVHGYGAALDTLSWIRPDGYLNVVGAPASNRVYTSSGAFLSPVVDVDITPENLPETETRFGSVVSLSYDPLNMGFPSVIAVCGGSADRVYVLENLAESRAVSNQNWTLVASLEIVGAEACVVHLTTLVVGSPSTDSVHVFEAGPEIGDWADVQETRVLSGATGEMFGAAVGLTRRSIFVGAPGAADGSGVVRQFALDGTEQDEFAAPEEGVTGWGSNLAVSDPFASSNQGQPSINAVHATLVIAPQMGGDLIGVYGRRSTLAEIAAGTDTSAFQLIDTVVRPEGGSPTHFGQVLDAQYGSCLIGGSADDEALPESLIVTHWEVEEGTPVLEDRPWRPSIVYDRQTWVDVAGDRITAMVDTINPELLMTWSIGDSDAVADGATPDEILIPDTQFNSAFAIQSDGTTLVREMVFGPDHDPQELDMLGSPTEIDLSGGVGAMSVYRGFQAFVKTDIDDGDGTIAWVAAPLMEHGHTTLEVATAVDVAAGGETIAVGFGFYGVPPYVMVYKRTAPLQWAEHQLLELEGPGRFVVPIRSPNDVFSSPTQVEMSEDGLLLVVAHGGLLVGETTRPEDATEAITLVFERPSVDDDFALVQEIRIESTWGSFEVFASGPQERVGHAMSLSGGPDGALLALLVGDQWVAQSKVAVFHRAAAGADFVEIARVGGAVPGVHVTVPPPDRAPTNVFCLRGSRLVVAMSLYDANGTDPMLGDNHLWVVDFDVEIAAVDTPVELFEPTQSEPQPQPQSQSTKPSDDDDDDDSKKASGAAQTGPASAGLSLAVAVVVAAML